jgi:hypothetical protein
MQSVYAAGAGRGEVCPWESAKDDKIKPAANGRIDRLVYELSEDEVRIVDNKIPMMPSITLLVGEHCNHRAPSRVCAGRNDYDRRSRG